MPGLTGTSGYGFYGATISNFTINANSLFGNSGYAAFYLPLSVTYNLFESNYASGFGRGYYESSGSGDNYNYVIGNNFAGGTFTKLMLLETKHS